MIKKKLVAKPVSKAPAPAPAAPAPESAEPRKRVRGVELLRGFKDILPEEQLYWDAVRDTARTLANYYSFSRIDLPILEHEELFLRGVGKVTDIVEKEMYTFEDLSGERVALRPEATASAARAYIEHGMLNRPQPVKLFYMGQMFRHDRPQAGRYRQFHQFGFESIGEGDPIVDAQLMVIAHAFFKDLDIPVTLQVNSIGTPETRKEYAVELVSYLRGFRNQLSEDDKRRLQRSPLRVLDSKEPGMEEILAGAPQIVDWLDDDSKAHFMKVLEYLDEIDVPYRLNPQLVRGLDYYNRTAFEIVSADDTGERAQTALGGGGRYDGLVELLGGREGTPACGFAVGMDRVVNLMRERSITPNVRFLPKIFFAQLGEASRRKGLRLYEEFRKAGVPISEAFGRGALKAQLEYANKLGCAFTLILGQKEVLDGTIIVRDMDSGAQEIVDAKKVVSIMQKRLGIEGMEIKNGW